MPATLLMVVSPKVKQLTKYNESFEVENEKLGQKKNTVDVTNTYNNVPTTGIIMNTLPYVMMML